MHETDFNNLSLVWKKSPVRTHVPVLQGGKVIGRKEIVIIIIGLLITACIVNDYFQEAKDWEEDMQYELHGYGNRASDHNNIPRD